MRGTISEHKASYIQKKDTEPTDMEFSEEPQMAKSMKKRFGFDRNSKPKMGKENE